MDNLITAIKDKIKIDSIHILIVFSFTVVA